MLFFIYLFYIKLTHNTNKSILNVTGKNYLQKYKIIVIKYRLIKKLIKCSREKQMFIKSIIVYYANTITQTKLVCSAQLF